MTEEKSLIGKEILNYRIENLIGKGGMGSVYLAANKSINQKVAIKVLHANLAKNEFVRRKFVGEAETLLKLDHSNIVKFLNFYEDNDGIYLVMEYVDGVTLDDFINNKNGLIVENMAYGMFAQILDAFAYAHNQGVVHRDIKPNNIILTHDNEGNFVLKVLDFGIAQLVSESNDDEQGMLIGTPLYMSPEQVNNRSVDERSDIYSLGVLLHQMLTGRAPYDETTMSEIEIMQKVSNSPLPRMTEFYRYISERMQKVVDKATAKSPSARYQNCAAFRKNFLPKPPIPLWQKMAAAALFLLLAGGGFWFWDYNYNVKIYYYKDYVEQWGVPVGIGKADYKHREGSYRFEKRKGKIDRLLHVNSRNKIVGHSDSEHTERIVNAKYYYTADGRVNYVEIMDGNNKILYKKVYDENLKTVIFKYADEFGAEMCLAASTTKLFANSFDNAQKDVGRISRYLLAYDENGYVKRLQYAGFQNVLVSDADGLFGREYVVDEKGRIIEERFLGHDGTPKANKVGLAIKKFEYNQKDDWSKVTYYAANGEFSSDGNGCPVVVIDNDQWGNRIKETYYDGEGNLALRKDIKVAGFTYIRNDEGYRIVQSVFGIDATPCYWGDFGFSSMVSEYDDNGYLAKTMYKDMDDNLVTHRDGNAILVLKNDERGNILERKFFDVNHQICESIYGVAKIVYEYDLLGNQTSEFYFDANDSLSLSSGGYAGLRMKYNIKNKLIEWSYHCADYQPCAVNGFYVVKYDYDPRENEIKRSFFSADGITLALNDNERIAGWESKYDDNGNETERRFFDTSENSTSGNMGYAMWIATYDSNGNMEELKNMDTNGQLVFVASDGYAGIKYKYDNRGNRIEKYPYGTNGRLIERLTRYHFDSRDNLIETAYYDQNNNPVISADGYFRVVSEYDNRNNIIEMRYYNTANRLFAPHTDNYAIVRYKYDIRGNNVEVAFFNDLEKSVLKKDGYATHRSEFDAMGRIIRQTYFDENGNPTNPSVMVPEGLIGYDKWGNVNYLAAADGHGKLINTPNGWAISRRTYNIKGNLLEIAYFNKDDAPTINGNENAHRITYTYNSQNQKIEESYYSSTNELRRENYAITRYKFNEQRKVSEMTFFNYQDKAVDYNNIAHKFVYTYDTNGNYSLLRRYKANGALEATLRWNSLIQSWEFVDTDAPTALWQKQVQKYAKACPYSIDDEKEIRSIALTANGFEMQLRYVNVSMFNIAESKLGEFRNEAREIATNLKRELNMPANARITVIGIDRVNREMYRITY